MYRTKKDPKLPKQSREEQTKTKSITFPNLKLYYKTTGIETPIDTDNSVVMARGKEGKGLGGGGQRVRKGDVCIASTIKIKLNIHIYMHTHVYIMYWQKKDTQTNSKLTAPRNAKHIWTTILQQWNQEYRMEKGKSLQLVVLKKLDSHMQKLKYSP